MITKDNYEEYFLLYVDNELSASDRKLVEEWVAAHPDLREELEALLSTQVEPEENFVFRNKEMLLRHEEHPAHAGQAFEAPKTIGAAPITEENYEGYLLSFIDGELDWSDRAAVEEYLRREPSKLAELQLLRRTISQPDETILFPYKESLYRSEKKRRVLFMPWLGIGVAAAVLGVVGLLFLLRQNEGRDKNFASNAGSASTTPSQSAAVTKSGSAALHKDQTAGANGTAAGGDSEGGSVAAGSGEGGSDGPKANRAIAQTGGAKAGDTDGSGDANRNAAATGSKASGTGRDVAATGGGHSDTQTAIAASGGTKPGNGGVKAGGGSEDGDSDTGSSSDAIASTAPVHAPDKAATGSLAIAVKETTIPKEQSSFATQALMREESHDDDKESSIASEDTPSGKSKLRGFFRKVTRTLVKTENRDRDGQKQVLVGAFQVTL